MGNRNSGKSYTRDILTEIYRLSGMKSFRGDLIDRMKTGWGRVLLATKNRLQEINSASLCGLAGRYDNPLPSRFLAPHRLI
jgi:hypothetical protein